MWVGSSWNKGSGDGLLPTGAKKGRVWRLSWEGHFGRTLATAVSWPGTMGCGTSPFLESASQFGRWTVGER